METTQEIIQPGQIQKYAKKNTSDDLGKFYSYFKKLNARKQQNEEYIPTRSEALAPLDYEISEQKR